MPFRVGSSSLSCKDGWVLALVAFNANNMVTLAEILKARYPNKEYIVCADNDVNPDSNTGVKAAIKAAAILGCPVAIPPGDRKMDFNDLHIDQGLDTVRDVIARAGKPENNTGYVIINASSVQPQPIRWLWFGIFALGKYSLLVGDPGLGKSLLTLKIASHVSAGTPWPFDSAPCPTGDVLILSAEDDIADTMRPRLEAAGADLDRVDFQTFVRDKDPNGEIRQRTFSLKDDLARLSATLTQSGKDYRLIICDPISSFVGGVDSYKNAEVRSLLHPVMEVISKHGVAFIGVSHLNKSGESGNAIYRATGSLAFIAAARASFLVAKDPEGSEVRFMIPLKNNLAADTRGIAYNVDEKITDGIIAAHAVWNPTEVGANASEALAAAAASSREPTKLDKAEDWLASRLSNGSVDSHTIWSEAKALGFSDRTVKRAKKGLDIQTDWTAKDSTLWRLPEVGGWEEVVI